MKGNKMKLINLIGKAFILLGIIMMASSYASYEKLELCEEMQIVEPDNKKIYVRQLITEEKQREKSIT